MKTALVIGMDTNSIAVSISASLLASGYRVVATSEGKFDPDSDARKRFDRENAEHQPVKFEPVDLSSPESVLNLVARLANDNFDLIVNSASTLAIKPNGQLRNEAVDFDYAEFIRVMTSNVAPVAAICLGLKNQIRPGGVIINITSSAGSEGAFATLSYNASKAAVDSLTKSLANVLGPMRGIRVNSIAPGWIPPSPDVAAGGIVALANAMTPSLVVGQPEHVVAAVHYLINNTFQNGEILPVDGGLTSSYLPYMLEHLQLQGALDDEELRVVVNLIERAKEKLRS